jgi:sulfite reductase (NADPH) hemoprotein beta-component
MYQYDAIDQSIIEERVAQFRDQTKRYLGGEIEEEVYQTLRLQNGIYIQTHAPMLRVAIPYGVLSSRQLRVLADIAWKFDRGYGHFSTRQNIQFNWPKLEDTPEILARLATVQMHAIQTSGNCIRNTTCDHLAGIALDEVADPRPYCELIRQWSSFHPEFAHLPRKFKIAFTGAKQDRAAIAVHDIGYRVVKNDSQQLGFQVTVGGGQGRTPVIGSVMREFLAEEDLLSYSEAILRIYNLYGRRDNKYKARIKILVNSLGLEEFTRLVDKEWDEIREGELKLSKKEIVAMGQHFDTSLQIPNFREKVKRPPVAVFSSTLLNTDEVSANSFKNWQKRNITRQKQVGFFAVYVSLKSASQAPGDATAEQMLCIAEAAENFASGEIRVTHDQNLVIPNVHESHLPEIWEKLHSSKLATPNIGLLTDMICCPGLDFCQLANAGSIPVAKRINAKFDDLDYLHDIGDLKIKMSGCMNACGHHHVGHIGILGVDKKGEEYYQFTLGGSAENDVALGERLGPAVKKDDVVTVVQRLLDTYVSLRQESERFLDTYRRVGISPFKDAAYAEPDNREAA